MPETRRRLILSGPIGCGKSTLIKNALGERASAAGGFITVRVSEGGILRGFDMLPACALVCPGLRGRRFLSFGENGAVRDETAFSGSAAGLLQAARSSRFAVVDEFGGWELTVAGFRGELESFLRSGVPCVGVLKSLPAAEELCRRMGLGEGYMTEAVKLRAALEADADTLLLDTSGRYDADAEEKLRMWVKEYA